MSSWDYEWMQKAVMNYRREVARKTGYNVSGNDGIYDCNITVLQS